MSEKTEAELIDLINKTPELQSVLHDVGLMPEQMSGAVLAWRVAWRRMLAYAHLWHLAMEKYEPELAEVTAQRDELSARAKKVLRTINSENIAASIKGRHADLLPEEIEAITARGDLFSAIAEIESTKKGLPINDMDVLLPKQQGI